MKSTVALLSAALAAQQVAAHATFQQLWVNGSYCLRPPQSNSPVTSVSGTDIRCNVNGLTGVPHKCPVVAGQSVTIEMHQQMGDRTCKTEAIGGAHYGPVQVYLTKVADATTADGSTGWFKIFQDTWAPKAGANSGDGDYWGTNDLNTCCGRMDVLIPKDIEAGDYLLRAEVVALHVAAQSGGAQFYMSCFQLSVTGGGSAKPATVNFPGAYKASDAGILVNVHAALATYAAPGPTVYAGGSTKSAGATCANFETATGVGPLYSAPTAGAGGNSGSSPSAVPTAATPVTSAAVQTSAVVPVASSAAPPPAEPTPAAPASCAAAMYGQCGGIGFSGCTSCAGSATCRAISAPYYYQCM